MDTDLTISEKLLLLSIRPDKGGIFWTTAQSLDYCLMGALLMELDQSGYVKIEDKRVTLIRETSQHPLYYWLLEKMARSGRPRKIGHWLDPFVVSGKKIRSGLYQSLSGKKLIRLEDKRFLFFTWKKPWLQSTTQVWRLVDNLKNLMYQDPERPEDLVLAALLEPAELWGRVYAERSKRKSARLRIRQLLDKPQPPEAMRHSIEAVRAVVRAVKTSVNARRAASA